MACKITSIEALKDPGIRNLMEPGKGQRIVEGIRKAVPFNHILVSGLDLYGFGVGTGTILASTFPASYLAAYYEEGHVQHDPLVKLAMAGEGTVSDEQALSDARRSNKRQRLLRLMGDYRIGHRTVVPLARAGRLYGSVVVTSAQPLSAGELEYLEFTAEPLHKAMAQPFLADMTSRMGLTKGLLYCLELAAQGMTSEEIAAQSSYTFETVNSYLKDATKKLGAANRLQAVAEALRRGLIS